MSRRGRLFQVYVNTGCGEPAGTSESKPPCHISALNLEATPEDHLACVNIAADKRPL